MRDDQTPVLLGAVPRTYDPTYFDVMMRRIEIHLNMIAQRGSIRVSNVNISDLPTSATGLRSGDLWSDSGTVKIVA